MWTSEALEVIQQVKSSGNSGSHTRLAKTLASALCDFAHSKSQQRTGSTRPFGARAHRAGYRWQGGKEDDITVLVAIVTEEPPSSKL